jgi:hypothetical protein
MSFTYPLALLLLLLLIPVALLYWLRLRLPRMVVGTVSFWQQALAEEPFRARWQRWRTPVSLVLHMLTVILLALAAAGPAIPPPQRIVLILDNSATMRATDVQPSRFEVAKEAARRMITGLRWCDEMAIFVTSIVPVEVQPFTSDRELLRTAVDAIPVVAQPPAITWAAKAAREIRAPGQPRLVLITDGCVNPDSREALRNGVEILRVGTAAPNRAITCFTARRRTADPTECELFVEVVNHGDKTAQGSVELSAGNDLRGSANFTIDREGRWRHLFELKLPSAARLTARIAPTDAYPFDDSAQLNVEAPATRSLSEVACPSIVPDRSEGGVAALYRGILIAQSHPKEPYVVHLPFLRSLGPFYGEPNGVDIRTPAEIGRDAAAAQFDSPGLPSWMPFAAAAVLVLVLEWCLYQRRWTS